MTWIAVYWQYESDGGYFMAKKYIDAKSYDEALMAFKSATDGKLIKSLCWIAPKEQPQQRIIKPSDSVPNFVKGMGIILCMMLLSCSKTPIKWDKPKKVAISGPVVLWDNETINDVIVLGGDTGIVIAGSNITINNVTVEGAKFAGIATRYTDWPAISKKNIIIRNTTVTGTTGIKGQRPHTGHGIVLGGVDGALISQCTTNNNGYPYGEGNIGQWCYDSRNVVIEYSESHNNISTGNYDGGGFDIDGGSSNCTIRYCNSSNNTGAGFMIYDYGSPNTMIGNTITYCNSVNDGSKPYLSNYFVGTASKPFSCAISHSTAQPLPNKNPLINSGGIDIGLVGNNF